MIPPVTTYMTPQAFIEQYGAQLRKALPNLVDLPIVKLRMTAAMANGLSWTEGFQYALEQRRAISAMRSEMRQPAAGMRPQTPAGDPHEYLRALGVAFPRVPPPQVPPAAVPRPYWFSVPEDAA